MKNFLNLYSTYFVLVSAFVAAVPLIAQDDETIEVHRIYYVKVLKDIGIAPLETVVRKEGFDIGYRMFFDYAYTGTSICVTVCAKRNSYEGAIVRTLTWNSEVEHTSTIPETGRNLTRDEYRDIAETIKRTECFELPTYQKGVPKMEALKLIFAEFCYPKGNNSKFVVRSMYRSDALLPYFRAMSLIGHSPFGEWKELEPSASEVKQESRVKSRKEK
ncbi:MAG: hypothetical protein R3F19_18625 [Verrucomicrobiales bacterium]